MIIVDATRFAIDDEVKDFKCQLVVNPANLIQSMAESWRMINGLPYDAILKAGYWVKHSDNQRVRLATRDEIRQHDALVVVMEIGMDISGEI